MNETREIGSFIGVTADGRRVRVRNMQELVVSKTRGGTTRTPSLTYFVTDDGERVQQDQSGIYRTSLGIAITPEIVNAR